MTNTCVWSSNLVMNPNLLPSKSSNNQENIANDGENDFKPLDLGGFPWLSCKKIGNFNDELLDLLGFPMIFAECPNNFHHQVSQLRWQCPPGVRG